METSTLLLVVAFLCVAVYWFYKWATENNNYFTERGIKFSSPTFLFGNNLAVFTRKDDVLQFLKRSYFEFPEERLVGSFDMRRPVYTIRDPELIKQIAIKGFNHFPQRRMLMDPESDPLFMKSLFALTGPKWQHMRMTLSPAFTSSKMRNMFGLMTNCGKKLVDFVDETYKIKGRQHVEIRDFFSRFANDVIATCAFGIEVDSFKEKNNKFFSNGERLRNFQSTSFALRLLGLFLVPWLMKILKIGLIDKTACSYFSKVLEQNFADRERHNIIRHDMVHLLLQAKKGHLKVDGNEPNKSAEGFAVVDEVLQSDETTSNQIQWSDDYLISQCFIFFFAGFESISAIIPMLAYELVAQPEIQTKLFNEVLATNVGLENGELTYEALNQMKYLDMVVSEALRKWPPTISLDRLCTKDYKIQHNGQDLVIEKDTFVMFPVYALHHDPTYYPDPEKFIPERFDDENKRNIVPGSYLPFGIGPRNCIGSRFALMEIKILFYYVLLNFSLEVTEKTEIPFKLSKRLTTYYPDKGIWLELKPRNSRL